MSEAIGNFNFVSIEGVPVDRGPKVIPESRFGKDDVYIFKTASQRGKQFTATTFADFSTLAAAQSALQSYIQAIGTTVLLQYGNLIQPRLVTVLDVDPRACRSIVAGYGGLESVGRAKLVAEWKLITRNVDYVAP